MIGSFGKASRISRTVSPTPLLWPCAVETATTSTPRSTKRADVSDDAVAVEFAGGRARGGDAGAAEEAEAVIARGLQLALPFLQDALDVADGEEAAELIVLIDDEQLVDADVLGEEAVGSRDRIVAEFGLAGSCAPARAASWPASRVIAA